MITVIFDATKPPALKITFRGRPKRQTINRVIRGVLEQCKSNIRTQGEGRWLSIQWDYANGRSTGDPALYNTEDQWIVERISPHVYRLIPRSKYRKSWGAHVRGIYIRAKTPRGMRVPFASGVARLQVVKLPRRDPRPGQSQTRRILRGL